MPITKSAIKALRKDKRKRVINQAVRTKLKQAVKKARQHPTTKNLKLAFSILDRAAKKRIIHKNRAAKLKSRLAKLRKK